MTRFSDLIHAHIPQRDDRAAEIERIMDLYLITATSEIKLALMRAKIHPSGADTIHNNAPERVNFPEYSKRGVL